jgi:hypothetical protein
MEVNDPPNRTRYVKQSARQLLGRLNYLFGVSLPVATIASWRRSREIFNPIRFPALPAVRGKRLLAVE